MHKAYDPSCAEPGVVEDEASASSAAVQHTKRRIFSSASIFQKRTARSASPGSDSPSPAADTTKPHTDELHAYLALPQIENMDEWTALKWWKMNEKHFPNLAVMARQYLGCPATSATVERLFSSVGISFSSKRRNAKSDTLANIAFIKMNLD